MGGPSFGWSGLKRRKRETKATYEAPPGASRFMRSVNSRLSLGSIRDLSRAYRWLSDGKGEESCSSVIKKSWGVEVTSGLGWWGKKSQLEKKTEEDQDFVSSHPPIHLYVFSFHSNRFHLV